jgi:4a-hydroxytetrahydrobiopterin dehydratase
MQDVLEIMAEILGEAAIEQWLDKVPEWEVDDACISRTFEFETYMDGIDFVNRVAEVAEEEDHHPEMDVRYGWVEVSLTSDEEGGLTEKDFLVAQRIDTLAGDEPGGE